MYKIAAGRPLEDCTHSTGVVAIVVLTSEHSLDKYVQSSECSYGPPAGIPAGSDGQVGAAVCAFLLSSTRRDLADGHGIVIGRLR
jgi:hypothetical protein